MRVNLYDPNGQRCRSGEVVGHDAATGTMEVRWLPWWRQWLLRARAACVGAWARLRRRR